MKKIVVLILLLIGLSAGAYFFLQTNNSPSQLNQVNAIPKQFPIALQSGNWTQAIQKIDSSKYANFINNKDWLIATKLHLEWLQQKAFSSQRELLIAFGNAGNNRLAILAVAEWNPIQQEEQLLQNLKNEAKSYQFEGKTIYSIQQDLILPSLHFTIYENQFIFSTQSAFVEEALLAIQNKDANWEVINELDNTADLRCYLNPNSFSFLSGYLFQANKSNQFENWSTLTDHIALEVYLLNDAILANGFAQKDSLQLSAEINCKTNEDIVGMLPYNTAYYQSYCISASSDLIPHHQLLKRVLGESTTLFTLETFNAQIHERQGAFFQSSGENIKEAFQEIDSQFEIEKISNYDCIKSTEVDLMNSFLQQPNYFNNEFYVASINNYIVISEFQSVIEQAIHAIQSLNVLKNQTNYADFNSSMAQHAGLNRYINVDLLSAYLSTITTENTWKDEINQIQIQLNPLNDKLFTALKMNFVNEIAVQTQDIWKTHLDTTSHFKPQIVINHNDNSNEILVQDDKLQLYLLNNAGQIQFKIPIKGKILSEIYQIDYYNNDKLQYVFNTTDQIYIVDRNGDRVDAFPIDLPTKATNGMRVLNYDNAGIYRYFVACDNGNFYGYEKNGSPLAGWSPLKNVGSVLHELQYVVVDQKDYLYFSNSNGEFYTFNRKGEMRFSTVKTNVKNGSFHWEDDRFVGGDFGQVQEIRITGKLSNKAILDSSYRHFTFSPSIINDEKAYAFANQKQFKYQLSQWKSLADFSVDDIHQIETFINNNNRWFIIYTNDKAYMIDELGNSHPDFPVETKSPIRLVYLIEGKDRLLLYNDLEGNLLLRSLKWTN